MRGDLQEVGNVGANLLLSPALLRPLPCGSRIIEVLSCATARAVCNGLAGLAIMMMSVVSHAVHAIASMLAHLRCITCLERLWSNNLKVRIILLGQLHKTQDSDHQDPNSDPGDKV